MTEELDEFDFVIAQSKGTCAGSMQRVCSATGGGTWILVSGSCSGTCVGSTECGGTGGEPACISSRYGQGFTEGCGCF